MAYRPPDVLEVLWTLDLRNGNQHRLQVVHFGSPARPGVVQLEVRELIHPDQVATASPPVAAFDERGYGVGLTKGLRIDHLEWILRHPDQVLAAMISGKRAVLEARIDDLGRPLR